MLKLRRVISVLINFVDELNSKKIDELVDELNNPYVWSNRRL